jgi:pimeloyl-ACP methyl ester carboxylesterase
MLAALLPAACTRVVRPPESWPEAGCAAENPGGAGDGSVGAAELEETRYRLQVATGVQLEIHSSARRDASCTGAVVILPPGLDPGADLAGDGFGRRLAESGLYVVSFDPRGRGESDGQEDANGFTGQDDVAGLLRQVASEAVVDPTRVVVHSRSFGGALAAGALARHPELSPIGWVDYESPGWLSEDLAHAQEHTRERFEELAAGSGDADAFWEEREPARFIGSVEPPYRRVQGWPDHALDYAGAIVAMVNGATAAAAVYYDGARVEDRLDEASARAHADGGPLDPADDLVFDEIQAAMQGEG